MKEYRRDNDPHDHASIEGNFKDLNKHDQCYQTIIIFINFVEEFLDNLSDDDYYFSRHDYDEEYKKQRFNNNDEKHCLVSDIVVN